MQRTNGRRRAFVAGTILSAALAATFAPGVATEPAAAAPDPRPNIVLITSDDQRVDDMRAMPRTRTLLGAQGTTFENSYSTFPLCCPARATFMTGQYAHNHGVLGNRSATSPLGGFPDFDASSTVATWLQSAGYHTAFVGKFLNKYGAVKPIRVPPGWDDWNAAVGGGHYFDTRLFQNGTARQYTGPYQTDLYADISVRIIESQAAQDAPFFLYASYYAPHSGQPTEPDDPRISTPAVRPDLRDSYAGVPLPEPPGFDEADVSDKPGYVRRRGRIRAGMHAQLTESFQQRQESLVALDEAVDRTVAALRSIGELDNTVILFTSDNGYMQGEHRIHAGKTVPYDPSAKVPLLVRGPGFPAGIARGQLVGNIDVAPTLVDVADATAGLPLDGTSLLPIAESPNTHAGRSLVLEAGPRTVDGPWFYTAVRTPRWLYVDYDETEELELYDMANDPAQLTNQAGNPAFADIRAWLAGRLARLEQCAGATCR
jgi:N-acetylglucosamine-6-sulfatase